MEVLGERIWKLEREKEGSTQGRTQKESRSEPIHKTPEKETTQVPRKEAATLDQTQPVNSSGKRSYATVAATKPAQTPSQPWMKVSYGNRKNGAQVAVKAEQRGRRILFPRKSGGQLKLEADLMLAPNEELQKARVESKVRFSRVQYPPSGLVLALLTEKADATMLLPERSNLLIQAAKTVDNTLVGVEIIKQWQCLKVHGMSLERYLGPGKLKLLRREVESSTGILLKAMPHWLITEDFVKEQQDKSNKQKSAIVITVNNKIKAKRLIANRFQFGGIIKKVERYWDAGPGSNCIKCCEINHKR